MQSVMHFSHILLKTCYNICVKIGVYDPYLERDNAGGGEKYILDLAVYLSQSHDVDIFVNHPDDVILAQQRFGYDFSRIHTVPSLFTGSFFHKIQASLKYDLIIVLSDGSIPFLFSKRVFLHFQEPILRAPLSFWERIKMKRVAKVFCNSHYTKSYIDKVFDCSAHILSPLIVPNIMNVPKKNMILHVGNFRPLPDGDDFKKHQFMIASFKMLVDGGLSGWHFVLAASVRDRDMALFDRMKESTQGYPIDILPNADTKTLWKYYNSAKIYWHASGFGENAKEDPHLVEHFGITTVEAMSAGAVPIVFGVGGQKEIVTHDVDGLLWKTQEEFITETTRVIERRPLYLRLSKQAMLRAQDFDRTHWEKQVEKLIA